jgi:hypothetical protein
MRTYREPSNAKLGAEIARARTRGEKAEPFCAREMRYDARRDAFSLELFSGATIIVPRSMIPGFERATMDMLRKSRLAPGGAAIIVNNDVDYSVPGILRLVSGIAEQRRAAGRVTSARKAAAVRRNGRKGGRPRKKAA